VFSLGHERQDPHGQVIGLRHVHGHEPYPTVAQRYEIGRRPRKTLETAVEPDASVEIVSPENATLEAIEPKLRKRAAWVTRQQRYFSQFLPRTPERRFVAGETHLYLGRQYRLKIVPHVQEGVKLIRGFIVVQTHRPTRPEVTRELVEAWCRNWDHIKFPERIELCLGLFADPEAFRPKGLIVRQIRQRWVSMSPAGRLQLNRRLEQAPVDTIDYLITHELCHVAEPHHGSAFLGLLGKVVPDWERNK
jgi:predicted metal-dependent hydrolase